MTRKQLDVRRDDMDELPRHVEHPHRVGVRVDWSVTVCLLACVSIVVI